MSEATQDRIRPVTIALFGAATLTLLLGIAIAVAYFSRPQPITLRIPDPAGGVVLTDLVIDGRPESRRDTAPVTYQFHAHEVKFAVIAEGVEGGNVRVEVSAGGGTSATGGAGVAGAGFVRAGGGGVTLNNMSPQHVENMRRSRASSSRTSGGELVPETKSPHLPAPSPAAR